MNTKQLHLQLKGLAVFRHLLADEAMEALVNLLENLSQWEDEDPDEMEPSPLFWQEFAVEAYGEFTARLYQTTDNLTDYVKTLLFEDENPYVKQVAKTGKATAKMRQAAEAELATLQAVCDLTSAEVIKALQYDGDLARWNNRKIDLAAEYENRMAHIHETGYGIYAKYRAFTVKEGKLAPVKHPDEQDLSGLFGYERERDLIIKNTEALVHGGYANNLLLYGDAGTGKSSSIKAVAKAYAPQGLRLVEIRKEQLFEIPELVEELAESPLKFILYIDDLSFNKNDDNFSSLKAILEGSISAAGDNIAVYATSNRRHLVKERMSDREGDELFTNDTLQEISSLSARFGLTITFQKPDKDEFLAIVSELAKKYKLKMDPEELNTRAEAFAIRMNGRTPRVAKQFVELAKAGILQ